ncbi:uncharacterized protein BDZ99DRAFT_522138 [Mytilinidion resinicola]|uniref:Uncharacterized protein n=1 Tax=Mytilinidion resinicola TaxID=574789 RepID=A0A6A6YIH6_9PEZI|nr:uncharacterized protein BDZ99DRAFT_522138 [Mytilinidion resinicola]KAF2808601.1 hypothetical protein BDZ99DRAFT_522138 [Mytilinidion resinicola]
MPASASQCQPVPASASQCSDSGTWQMAALAAGKTAALVEFSGLAASSGQRLLHNVDHVRHRVRRHVDDPVELCKRSSEDLDARQIDVLLSAGIAKRSSTPRMSSPTIASLNLAARCVSDASSHCPWPQHDSQIRHANRETLDRSGLPAVGLCALSPSWPAPLSSRRFQEAPSRPREPAKLASPAARDPSSFPNSSAALISTRLSGGRKCKAEKSITPIAPPGESKP